MNYGLLTYAEGRRTFNLGDYVQSLAARQFLPRVDTFVHRERMAAFSGPETRIILNGWFTHNIYDWIPSNDLRPLFESFHINNTAAPFLLSAEGVAYLKENGPIGCRDQFTVDTLKAKEIDAYFTGCLTLTLDNYSVDDSERDDRIFIVDPLYSYPTWNEVTESARVFARNIRNERFWKLGRRRRHLRNMVSEKLLATAEYRTQVPPSNFYSEPEKFRLAEGLLQEYARARLVITSRIHCALPCLAMGTPVIFINAFDSFVDSCRFDGILDLFNRIDVDTRTGEFTANFPLDGKIDVDTMVTNLGRHQALAGPMKERCKAFVEASWR